MDQFDIISAAFWYVDLCQYFVFPSSGISIDIARKSANKDMDHTRTDYSQIQSWQDDYVQVLKSPLLTRVQSIDKTIETQQVRSEQRTGSPPSMHPLPIPMAKQKWKQHQPSLMRSYEAHQLPKDSSALLETPVNVLAVTYSPLDELRHSLVTAETFRESRFMVPPLKESDVERIPQPSKPTILPEAQSSTLHLVDSNLQVTKSALHSSSTTSENKETSRVGEKRSEIQVIGLQENCDLRKRNKLINRCRSLLKSFCSSLFRCHKSPSPAASSFSFEYSDKHIK